MHHHPGIARKQRKSERGAGLVEYALLLALIAVVTFGAVAFFGGANKGGFGRSQSCIAAAYGGQAMDSNCG